MRRNLLVIIVLMMVLMGCQRAGSTDILLSEESGSGAALEESILGSDETSSDSSSDTSTVLVEKQPLVIFVCGAVKEPGVYYLEDGLRIVDAIEAAGGFSEDADKTFVNLAAPLTDGIKLQIPTLEESIEGTSGVAIDSFDNKPDSGSGLININKASKEELKTLPGIGDGIAGKIIDYRTENGNFSCIEDIMKVSGIKDKLFSKIKEHITV